MRQFWVLLLFFSPILAFAQPTELHFLKGKVLVDIDDLTTITVKNKRSETTANPDQTGNFSIFVKVNDVLIFEGLTIETKTWNITEEELKKKIVVVALVPNVIELKEVTIREYPEINAVSLGILQKPAKKYTPAERRLRAASNMDVTYGLGLNPGVSLSLDAIINAITGRTKRLIKELEIERREMALTSLSYQFSDEYLGEKLNLPSDRIGAFKYYAIENDTLRNLLQNKDRIKSEFQLAQLAARFLQLQQEDKP